MDFDLTPQQMAWVAEVRAFLRDNPAPSMSVDERDAFRRGYGPLAKPYVKRLIERGWYALGLPRQYGGTEKSAVDRFLFVEEVDYALMPVPDRLGTGSIAPAIIRYGTDDQKRRWVPRIAAGELAFAAGYSEPEAGSDLASLRTNAVLDGDEWVINGQKMWNSQAHACTHEWLACRTDPDAPKHRGLSLLIVPIDSPGISIHPIETWGKNITNQVWFDNVRVPKDYLIGQVSGGWRIMTSALSFERLVMCPIGTFRRMLDDLMAYCRLTTLDGQVLARKPLVRHRLAELQMELEVARLLTLRGAWMIDEGLAPDAEASMCKVYSSELGAKLTDTAMHVMEEYGQLDEHDPAVPMGGWIQELYRYVPMLRFGGGTNEIQRNIIAQRRLGLPR